MTDRLGRLIPRDDGMLTADDLRWTPEPATWLSPRQILAIALEVWPTIEDTLTADLIEHLASAIGDQEDELLAVRRVLSAALTHAYAQHVEILRLQRRRAEFLDARRRERTAA